MNIYLRWSEHVSQRLMPRLSTMYAWDIYNSCLGYLQCMPGIFTMYASDIYSVCLGLFTIRGIQCKYLRHTLYFQAHSSKCRVLDYKAFYLFKYNLDHRWESWSVCGAQCFPRGLGFTFSELLDGLILMQLSGLKGIKPKAEKSTSKKI